MKKWLFCFLMLLIASTFLIGCSDESVYSNVNSEIEIQNIADSQGGLDGYLTSERYLNWCQKAKWYAIPIIVVSILVGVFLVAVFKNEKNIRKTGIFVFLIGIPVSTLVIVYVACYMYGKLF